MMKKLIIITNLLLTVFTYAQSGLATTENYVYEKNCLSEDCSRKVENVQYFDGLGRLKQTIDIGGTPAGKDIIIPVEYDAYGRQTKDFLPVPQATNLAGAVYSDPLSNAVAIYGNEKIYSERILEASPLNKILQQNSVGNAWTGHSVKYSYASNTAAELKKYEVTTSWTEGRTVSILNLSGTYPANSLIKSEVTDEDGNTAIEFKNIKGQTILIRKNDGTQDIDTYYIYDKYGNLAYSIPPLAVKSGLTDQSTLDNLCYQYRYDEWGRLVEKKIPGKDWEYMVYDKQGRLVLSQDANLREAGKWLFTKYDQLSRPIYTGIFESTLQRTQQLAAIENFGANNEERSLGSFNNSGLDVYYSTDKAYPAGNYKVLIVSYYDTYPSYSFNPPFPEAILGKTVLTDKVTQDNTSTKGLPVMSLVKNIEDDNWTKTYNYYDVKARPIAVHTINHLGGFTRTESDLDFSGSVKKTITTHKRLNTDTGHAIVQNFEYDNQNRLVVQKHKVDDNDEEILSQNIYNERSELIKKKVGGTLGMPLQIIDYTYNIKGWTTKINDPADLNGKLFGYEIKYQNAIDVEKRYNGNITEIDWKTGSDGILKRYSYLYDSLNRLTSARYGEPFSSVPQNNFYNEEANYDVNGNITHLWRNDKGATSMAESIDNLTYNYTGNQLNSVTDGSANYKGYPEVSGNTIGYDKGGNMINQVDKGILEIRYNFINLPNYMKFNQLYFSRGVWQNVNTNFLYSADGTKLQKIFKYSENSVYKQKITEYLDGFQYEIISTSTDPELKFVPTSEGYYNFENNKYIYNYVDHLGNVRISYFNNGNSAEVLEENSYYPFGLKHGAFNGLGGNTSYKYQYNGKELQEETGWSDYGARLYMPELARWGVIDPLAEATRRMSPYTYGNNNPVLFLDPDGMLSQAFMNQIHGSAGGTTWYNTGAGFTNDAGGSMDYDGNTIRWGDSTTKRLLMEVGVDWGNGVGGGDDGVHIDLDNVEIKATGNSRNWNKGDNYFPNIFAMGIAFDRALASWNYRNGGAVIDPMGWIRADGPIKYTGSAGDPAGIFDVAGQVMSNWKPENRYLAMGAGILGAILLKKPQLALAEEKTVAKVALTDAELITKAVQKAENAIGGTGRFAGTAKHTYTNNLINRYQSIYGDRGLKTNFYFKTEISRGYLDIVNHSTKTIYDYKFGSAVMSNRQFMKYSTAFKDYSIQIIRP